MRLISAALMALLFVVGPALADGSSVDVYTQSKPKKDVTTPAREALEKEDYETALSHLVSAAETEPDNPDVHNLTGFSLRKLGRYEEAGAAYDKALSLSPEHTGALEYQGELFLKQGQIEKAKQNLDLLDDICWLGCESYYLLRDSIKAYEAAKNS